MADEQKSYEYIANKLDRAELLIEKLVKALEHYSGFGVRRTTDNVDEVRWFADEVLSEYYDAWYIKKPR